VPTPDQPKPAQPQGQSQVPGQATAPSSATPIDRRAALANSPRVPIATDTLQGTVALKGGRIDDLALVKFRETTNPKSPPIVLLSPSGTGDPFYAEFGWTGAAGANVKLPTSETVWKQVGSGGLGVGRPVTLTYDNGEGLEFRRTITVDDKYLFTIKDDVSNKSESPVTLFPYALISRHGIPPTAGYYVLHEGLIGVLGESGLQEFTYKNVEDKKSVSWDVTNGWLGITDKYWAATLLPDTSARLKARFSTSMLGTVRTFQTDYLLDAQTIAPGATASVNGRLFAGAKEVSIVGINFPLGGTGGYNKALGLNHFDLLIDWGWFYFITKPMFLVMDFFFRLFGNFGLAILMVTVLVKIVFFPLANKSYASMAKMKAVQPQMMALRERYANDKAKQQQELMELYKREKINPLAGCLPIVIQIPVFFSLYKVLFVTIEMRHAPFFGWIHDLSAQDPTNIFNLFGLIPVDPTILPLIGPFLHMGIWPIIMGITMWVQMKLNPAPPDPTQAMIFNWMPIMFTFMLASFPAGLVIYWAWNNLLSVLQQSVIMRKHGAKIELFDNIKTMFVKKTPQE
jgi:YidC/Oxa1 family membrane protein insertase